MRRLFRSMLLTATMLYCPAAYAGSGVATARATILRPTSLAAQDDLQFGTIAANNKGGAVHLDIESRLRTCTPGLVCSGVFIFARLSLSGADTAVQIQYDTQSELTGPGAPMTATMHFAGGQDATLPLQSNSTILQFGAELVVNPDQADGEYSGQFRISVDYP